MSSANRAVEAAENKDPVGIVKLNIQKAKEELVKFESAVQSIGAEKIRLSKRGVDLKQQISKWISNAESALAGGNEELARKAIEQQTKLEHELEGVNASLATTSKNFDKMKAKVISQTALIADKASEVSSLEARQRSAQASLQIQKAVANVEGTGEALGQVEIFADKVEALEAQAAAAEELSDAITGQDVAQQFEDMHANKAVEERLAALKAKMAQPKV